MLGIVHGPPVEGRLIQLWMYKRSSPNDNHYAHPIEFVPFIDLNKRKVMHPCFQFGCKWAPDSQYVQATASLTRK